MKIKLKFRKRIKFSLGFTINFSKSGMSTTIVIKDTSNKYRQKTVIFKYRNSC
ncbi:DUF4236 domain-containing protein [Campylobacter hominis]|uniref:DUF4236 domain-containing protein n=1 Tax=Campylobacter hominis TaxID=76517 RepID=UPI003CCFE1C5